MMPPSRPCVLMTADAVGGVWVFATTLAGALTRRGYRVHLVVLGPGPSPGQLEPLRHDPNLHVETADLALEWLDPAGQDLGRAFDRLTAIEHRVGADVVHLNGFREAGAAWRAPVMVTAHSCVWSWWRACRGGTPSERRWHLYRDHVEAGLGAADGWVAPTKALAGEIRRIYAPPHPGIVIRNGIEAITPAEKSPVILAAGRLWDEAKNVAALEPAAEHLDWPIRIAGSLRSEDGNTRHFGASRLRMLGPLARTQLVAEMRRAAIFVSPARYEPFGLAVLEAAAAGCALLLSDIESFRELWSGAAWFVDPDDPDAIRAALERLCRDDDLRRSLQAAARVRAQRYPLTATVAAYCRAYEQLRKRQPASSPHRATPAHAEASA